MQILPEACGAFNVSGAAMAAELTRVYKDLRQKYDSLDNQEHFDVLRSLTFFHEFSHAEIWEVLRASDWHEYKDGDDIVREGEIDDRFYIIVTGSVRVEANGNNLGTLANGDCFGETSYVRGAKRQASIKANGAVTMLRVSSSLMEQVSSSCQLRFNKVFLRALITRLQGDGSNSVELTLRIVTGPLALIDAVRSLSSTSSPMPRYGKYFAPATGTSIKTALIDAVRLAPRT